MAESTTNPKTDSSGQTAEQLASQAGLTTDTDKAAVAANEAEGQNPDAAVGSALMEKKKEPDVPAMTSDLADAQAETTGAAVTTAASGLNQRSEDANTQAFDLLDKMAKTSAQDRADSIANIERQREIDLADTKTGQRLETGATSRRMARIGGYLGGTGSATSYINSLSQSHRLEVTKIQAMYAAAIEKAKVAYSMKDMELASKLMDAANGYQNQLETKRMNDMAILTQTAALETTQRENDIASLAAWAADGKTVDDIPEGMFSEMDKKANRRPGTSKQFFSLAVKERELKDLTDAETIKKASLENVTLLQTVLDNTAAGESVTIDGFTYFGTKGSGIVEIDESTGMGRMFRVDQTNGEIIPVDLGYIGAKKDGYETVMIGGEPFGFNPSTGDYKTTSGPKLELNKIVPPRTYKSTNFKDINGDPLPLQCGELINEMCGAMVGSTLAEKMAKIDTSIKAETAIEGNTVVFGGSSTGHVAAINSVYTDLAGRLKFVLSEANYKSPGMITHDREVYADDPNIKGFMKTAFREEYISGSDAGRLEAAIARENTKKNTSSELFTSLNDFTDPLERSVASDLIDVGKNKDVREKTSSDFAYALKISKETGDPSWVRDEIRNKIIAGSFAAGTSAIEGRNATISGLEKAQLMVEEMVSKNKNLDIFTGTYEQIYNKLGETGDPTLRELATFIRPMMMDYRKTQTGVAFSEKEAVQYEELFPNTKQTPTLFKANVSGLLKAMRNADESLIRTKIGNKAYEKYFIDPIVVPKGTKTTAPRSSVTAVDIANAEKDGWAVSTNTDGTITFTKL